MGAVGWVVASVAWTVSWTLLILGLANDNLELLALSIFVAVCGATAMSLVIADYVAGRVAHGIVAMERVRIEEMTETVARVVANEMRTGRIGRPD